MAVTTADLVVYLASGGSSDNGAKSATALASGVANGLWPNVADAQRTAGGTRTKKWFLANESGTDALSKPVLWDALVAPGVTEELGLGFDSADDADPAQGNMTAFGANAVASLVSSAADTRTVTLYGLNAAGVPIAEVVTLTGAVAVSSTTTWSKLWAGVVSALNGNTITIKQGPGGTTRGTIGANKKSCWLWVNAIGQSSGILLPSLAAGSSYGFWDRQTWAAGTASAVLTRQRVALVETT